MIYLDTHVVVWLFAGQPDLISEEGKLAIEKNDLMISPMVQLELQFLYEIKRINYVSDEIIKDLQMRIGLKICDIEFPSVVRRSLRENWTRDLFDRMIVSQAAVANDVRLLTKDRKILTHYDSAFW